MLKKCLKIVFVTASILFILYVVNILINAFGNIVGIILDKYYMYIFAAFILTCLVLDVLSDKLKH